MVYQSLSLSLSLDGSLLYVAPITGRDGMDELIARLAEHNLICVEQFPPPPE